MHAIDGASVITACHTKPVRHSSAGGINGKLNDVDPQAWLADVLARIASTPQGRLNQLLPWEWKKIPVQSAT